MSMLFLISLIPMALFVVVDYFTRNLKASIFSAIITSLAMGGLTYYLLGEFDYEVVVIVVSMLITGLISVKMNTPIYFKFQPVITGVILAGVLAYFQWFDTPLLVKMLPKVATVIEENDLATPEMVRFLQDDSRIPMYERLTIYMIVWLLIHAVLVAVCALKFRNSIWLLAKAFGVPFVAIGALLTEKILH